MSTTERAPNWNTTISESSRLDVLQRHNCYCSALALTTFSSWKNRARKNDRGSLRNRRFTCTIIGRIIEYGHWLVWAQLGKQHNTAKRIKTQQRYVNSNTNKTIIATWISL